jgi:phosphatidate cytidylyltransferase
MFMVSVPVVGAVVVFLPQRNHLVLNALTVLACALGASEFAAMLRRRGIAVERVEAVVLGVAPAAAGTLAVSFNYPTTAPEATVLLCAMYCMIRCAFTSADGLANAASVACARLAVMLYPGTLLGCLILLSMLSPEPAAQTALILTYILMVFLNDGAAWLFGRLLGRGNQGVAAVSPHKSVAGFIAGLTASVIVGLVAAALPITGGAFASPVLPRAIAAGLLGLCTGAASIVGDLAESALKRGCGVKDSGTLMPGRGGVLDCVDSLSLAAPVFLLLYRALF